MAAQADELKLGRPPFPITFDIITLISVPRPLRPYNVRRLNGGYTTDKKRWARSGTGSLLSSLTNSHSRPFAGGHILG